MSNKKSLLLLTCTLLLGSCFNVNPSSGSINIEGSSEDTTSEDTLTHYTADTTVKHFDGFYQRAMTYASKEYEPALAPSIGEQPVLLVPVHLAGKTSYKWDKSSINKAITAGQDFETYYTQVSRGYIHNPVTVLGDTETLFNASEIFTQNYFKDYDENTNFEHLYALIDEITEYMYNLEDFDITKYDTDHDGYIDSIHFVVDGSDDNVWGSAIWPHMNTIQRAPGTKDRPIVNTYSLSNLGHFDSARTMIHEQGHIYGLEDYYDYAYSNLNLVGSQDMQCNNKGDWNSFSKMSVGWAKPYVVDGSKKVTTITINPSMTSGDCIVVPCGDSYNDSPYDEYILLELYSKVGVNYKDWSNVLGNGGVRLYHVDARLWGYNEDNFVPDPSGDTYGEIVGGGYINSIYESTYEKHTISTSNSLGNSYARPGIKDLEYKFHLLHLIEATNKNTYGDLNNKYSYLKEADFFRTNDSFTIGSHDGYTNYGPSSFVNKDKCNNGETFNYGIYFKEVTPESATIEITKF